MNSVSWGQCRGCGLTPDAMTLISAYHLQCICSIQPGSIYSLVVLVLFNMVLFAAWLCWFYSTWFYLQPGCAGSIQHGSICSLVVLVLFNMVLFAAWLSGSICSLVVLVLFNMVLFAAWLCWFYSTWFYLQPGCTGSIQCGSICSLVVLVLFNMVLFAAWLCWFYSTWFYSTSCGAWRVKRRPSIRRSATDIMTQHTHSEYSSTLIVRCPKRLTWYTFSGFVICIWGEGGGHTNFVCTACNDSPPLTARPLDPGPTRQPSA